MKIFWWLLSHGLGLIGILLMGLVFILVCFLALLALAGEKTGNRTGVLA